MPGNRRRFSPAQPKTRACAQRNRRDLRERSGKEDDDRDSGKGDCRARSVRREGPRHAPVGLRDDRDSDKLEAVKKTFGKRSGERGGAHGEGEQD